MFFLCMQEFEKLAEDGKYHQLAQAILAKIEALSASELKHIYESVVVQNYYNIHPSAFSEISASFAKKLPQEDALRLLESSLSLLVSASSVDMDKEAPLVVRATKLAKGGNAAAVRLLLEIAHAKVRLGQISEARVILYDCREVQIEKKESLRKLHLSLGLMHYSTQNYAPAYKNMLEYLKLQSEDEETFEACLISGILSEDVYSFRELIDLHGGEESRALSLATALEEGNSSHAAEIAAKIDSSLQATVAEKAVVMRLLNYFFSQQQRSIRLQTISEELGLPALLVEETVLRILGSGLMKGTIDGITGEFTYTWIGYKHLTAQEIASIRNVISEMRLRVDTVRKEIS
ncbi:26S proteasome regulatory subunit N9 [Nematocida major]|uniref:26S proteasome regulatory subunit N9 n=1 Tax=Nematocida major TaxID=1912982 RepID=UPI0020087145|nr:26S proteasome regulatory subunit N9 [Nematocida major]KAH9386696.1 26S proteasome regulatory subunit N9 [Nematocida major]